MTYHEPPKHRKNLELIIIALATIQSVLIALYFSGHLK